MMIPPHKRLLDQPPSALHLVSHHQDMYLRLNSSLKNTMIFDRNILEGNPIINKRFDIVYKTKFSSCQVKPHEYFTLNFKKKIQFRILGQKDAIHLSDPAGTFLFEIRFWYRIFALPSPHFGGRVTIKLLLATYRLKA